MSPSPLCLLVSEPDCLLVVLSVLKHRKQVMNNTGNPFRSSVLGVMSPARCRCAMPVKCFGVMMIYVTHLWRIVSLKRPNYRIPPVGFDPTTSKLWAWRSAPELRRCDKCCAFMTQESFLKNNQRGEYRRQVSILWPSAYKAITIHKADYKVNEGANDVLRRSAAELHRYNVSGSGSCSKCLNTGAIWW